MSYSTSAYLMGGNQFAQQPAVASCYHHQQQPLAQVPAPAYPVGDNWFIQQPGVTNCSHLQQQPLAQVPAPGYLAGGYQFTQPPRSNNTFHLQQQQCAQVHTSGYLAGGNQFTQPLGISSPFHLQQQHFAQVPASAYPAGNNWFAQQPGVTNCSHLQQQPLAQVPTPAYLAGGNQFIQQPRVTCVTPAQIPAPDGGLLERLSMECQNLQRQSASKLRVVAKLLREEQRNMNIAKVSFSSIGVVAGGLNIAGAVLAPFTAGTSIGLCAVGSGIGLLTGVGDLITCAAEYKIIGSRVDEVQQILDHLAKTTEALLNSLKPKLEAFGISWVDVLDLLFKTGKQVWGAYNLYSNIQKALDLARATTHAQQIAVSLGGGEKVAKAVAKGMSDASSYSRLEGGFAGIKALNTSSKVTTMAGPIGSAIGIGISIKAIVDNNILIDENISEVADVIEKIANALLVAN